MITSLFIRLINYHEVNEIYLACDIHLDLLNRQISLIVLKVYFISGRFEGCAIAV